MAGEETSMEVAMLPEEGEVAEGDDIPWTSGIGEWDGCAAQNSAT